MAHSEKTNTFARTHCDVNRWFSVANLLVILWRECWTVFLKADLDFPCWVGYEDALFFLPLLLNVATWRQTEANINTERHAVLMRKARGKGLQLHLSDSGNRFAVTLNGTNLPSLATRFQFRPLCGVKMTQLIRACWVLFTHRVEWRMLWFTNKLPAGLQQTSTFMIR